jgi:uncharacterized protein DUF4304
VDVIGEIVRQVAEVARPLGYTKAGSRLRKQAGEVTSTVWYQKSRSSDYSRMKFTVNLEMVALPFLQAPWPKVSQLRSVEPDWSERLGFLLPANRDVWWEADADNMAELALLHASLFTEVIDPFLRDHGTLWWLASEWRAGRGGWLSEEQRERLLKRAEALGY